MTSLVIGSDFTVEYLGAKDAATGTALTSGTCTFALYTAAGVAVSGGTGSCAHVSGGDYRGVLESTAVSLTSGAAYYLLLTFSQSGYDDVRRVDVVARAPGGVIIDAQYWMDSAEQTVTGAALNAVNRHIAAVTSALQRKCYPHILTPQTLTLFAFDAPVNRSLFLPKPVRSISALYYRANAGGDSSVLDLTADLLTPAVDYRSAPTDVLTGWNRTGEIVRLNRSIWGYQGVRPVGQLASRLEPEPGAVFVSASVGPASVDPAVQEAACRAVSLLYQRRKTGAPVQSESWGGFSYSNAGQFTAEAAVNSPEVLGMLKDAGVLPAHVC